MASLLLSIQQNLPELNLEYRICVEDYKHPLLLSQIIVGKSLVCRRYNNNPVISVTVATIDKFLTEMSEKSLDQLQRVVVF